MPERDRQDDVVAAIRQTLPEFAKRNGIDLDDRVMDNLARWVSGVVPPRLYRVGCPGAFDSDEPYACACPGTCSTWLPIGVDPDAPIDRLELGPVGGVWVGSGSSDDFTVKNPS